MMIKGFAFFFFSDADTANTKLNTLHTRWEDQESFNDLDLQKCNSSFTSIPPPVYTKMVILYANFASSFSSSIHRSIDRSSKVTMINVKKTMTTLMMMTMMRLSEKERHREIERRKTNERSEGNWNIMELHDTEKEKKKKTIIKIRYNFYLFFISFFIFFFYRFLYFSFYLILPKFSYEINSKYRFKLNY